MKGIARVCAMAVVAGLVAHGGSTASAATVPDGFVDEHVADVSQPTAIASMVDGAALVTDKAGFVYLVRDGGSLLQVLNISGRVCQQQERGLGGIAVDPDFASNRFVYLYYTTRGLDCGTNPLTGARNRLGRFVMRANNAIDPNSEVILLDNIPNAGFIHNGGDIAFANDKTLLVSIGDGGCDYATISSCGDANDASRDRHTLLGKVVRITRDGQIPAGNPFAGGARCNTGNASAGQNCAETWASGFRNPFRMALDPEGSGIKLHVNDVGSITWEEIDDVKPGRDYGWNIREGFCARGSTTNCSTSPGGNVSGLINPIYAYLHGDCNSITGGAFVPSTLWPEPYAGSYLFGDFTCGRAWRLVETPGGGFDREEFASGLGLLTTFKFGPSPEGDALWYGTFTQSGGKIRRIRHVGAVNRKPVAALQATPSLGPLPLDVQLDASESSDPDGDALTYSFDPGDGSPVVEQADQVLNHTYTTAGTYTATVTVSDPAGATDSASVTIRPGNTAPELDLRLPAENYRFATDEQFTLQAIASDAQDGDVPGANIAWTVVRVHDDHTHPYMSGDTGASLDVVGPAPEDLNAITTSYLRVLVTATDSQGASTTKIVEIQPQIVNVEVASEGVNSGVPYTINGRSATTPTSHLTWAGSTVTITVPARTGFFSLWRFDRWNDFVRETRRVSKVGKSGERYVAIYRLL